MNVFRIRVSLTGHVLTELVTIRVTAKMVLEERAVKKVSTIYKLLLYDRSNDTCIQKCNNTISMLYRY